MTSRPAQDVGPSLWQRDFRLWFASRTISVAGAEATAVAVPILIYQQTGSGVLTGAVSALTVLPYLCFGLIAGALADRMNRKLLMVFSDVVAAVALISVPLAYLAGAGGFVHVLVVTFAVWTAFVWFDAAAWGSLTTLVGRDQLVKANSVIWSFGITAGIAMPAVAGAVIGATHPSVVLAVDGVTYLVSAFLIFRIRKNLAPAVDEPDLTKPSLARSIRDGLAYIWRMTEIRVVTLAAIGLTLSSGAVTGILIVHISRDLRIEATDWRVGLFFAAGATGALLASMLLPWLTKRLGSGRVSGLAFTAYVPALIAVVASGNWLVALGTWAVWYCTNTLAVTNGITIRQQLTPDELQGRVNTSARMIALGGTPVGALIGGVAADTLGVRQTYLLAAIPVAVAAIVLWLSSVRRLGATDQRASS